MEQNGAQWIRIHQLDQQMILSIYSLYQNPFFIEVRNFLSHWLEDRFLDCNLNSENSSHHPYITNLIGELNQELKSRANQLGLQDPTSYSIRVRLMQASKMIETGYPMLPIPLYHHIRYCLETERGLIRQSELAKTTNQPVTEDGISEMWANCNDLSVKLAAVSRLIKHIETCQENGVIQANSLKNLERVLMEHRTRSQSVPTSVPVSDFDLEQSISCQKDQLEKDILQQMLRINEKRKVLREKQGELLVSITEFQKKVFKALSIWKKEQRTTIYHTVSIEEIEKWSEVLVEAILSAGNQFQEINSLQQNFTFPPFVANLVTEYVLTDNSEFVNQVAGLLKELVQNAFIVESQPPQVIKKSTKFTTSIRFLIGNKLGLPIGGPINVDVCVLNDVGVREFVRKNGAAKVRTSGELLNGKQKFQLENSRYVAEFRNIHVRKVTHNAKKESGHSVLDEPFWLLFQSQFIYNRVTYKVFTFSVPIKVISHVSQETQAWETLIWGDAENEGGRSEYKPWPELAQNLSDKFHMMTKNGLNAEHLSVLEEKIRSVPDGSTPTSANTSNCVSWTQFCKNKIPERPFTFWTWFYEIAKLTAEHLCGNKFCKSGPWQDNLILGFTRRQMAEDLLGRTGKCGTFLLRFSDTELGGISISWLHINKTVMSVKPFTSKDLAALSLAERILGIGYLLYLYPDIPKHKAFESYISPQLKEGPTSNGTPKLTKSKYVRALLTTHLIIADDSSLQGDATPSTVAPESPYMENSLGPFSEIASSHEFSPAPSIEPPEPMDGLEDLGDSNTWIKELADYVLELCEVAENSPDGTAVEGFTNGEDGYHSSDGSTVEIHSPNDLQYIHL
jgi:signal transducer and activator of transcription 5B